MKHYSPRGASQRKMAHDAANKAIAAGEKVYIAKDGKRCVDFDGSKYGVKNRWYHVVLD
jgi:hypothetical protein